MIQGTVNGTSVAATTIRDGVMERAGMLGKKEGVSSTTPGAHLPDGNGQPIIGGKVTAINGTSLTVTNASNVTYAVDAISATISKSGVTDATVASIAVGDSVVVQGTVNGTSVIAASVLDTGTPPATPTSSTAPATHQGFFGAISGFFSHLFGF